MAVRLALFLIYTLRFALCSTPGSPTHVEEKKQDWVDEVRRAAKPNKVILKQRHFRHGTLRITKPGTYRLSEDIEFDPTLVVPDLNDDVYPRSAYSLGFFSAITVESSNVVIQLNGHTMGQSPSHRLHQRFFSTIELCNRPFIPGVGPPQFKHYTNASAVCAHNLLIEGPGTFTRSSHFAIHGNNNQNILIRNLNIRDFEVGGIALNGPYNVHIQDVLIGPSSVDVPVKAPWTHALLMVEAYQRLQFTSSLAWFAQSTPMTIAGHTTTVESVLLALTEAVEEIQQGTDPCVDVDHQRRRFNLSVFCNPTGLPDGSAVYGVMTHKDGPAVHTFGHCTAKEAALYSRGKGSYGQLKLLRVRIQGLQVQTDETVMVADRLGRVNMGATGDVFQPYAAADDEGRYQGNVVSDAQVALQVLADATGLSGNDRFELFGGVHISHDVVKWVSGDLTMPSLLSEHGHMLKCSGDAMDHTNKGAVGLRLEFLKGVYLRDITLEGLTNFGRPSPVCQAAPDRGLAITRIRSSGEQLQGGSASGTYQGADARGLATRFVLDLHINNLTINTVTSKWGFAAGWDMGRHTQLNTAHLVHTFAVDTSTRK